MADIKLDPALVDDLSTLYASIEHADIDVRVTGAFDTNGDLYNDPQLGLAQGYIWVHDEGGRSAVPAIVGDRMIPFQRTAGVSCVVGYNVKNELVAIAPFGDSNNAAANTAMSTAAQQSQYIQEKQFTAGLVTADKDGGYGLTVRVQPITYRDKALEGAVDVSSSVPTNAGERRLAVITWDVSDSAFVVVDGTPTTAATPFTLEDYVAIPLVEADRLRLGAVELAYGQTGIPLDNNFIQERDWLTLHTTSESPFDSLIMSADGFPMVDADGYFMLRS